MELDLIQETDFMTGSENKTRKCHAQYILDSAVFKKVDKDTRIVIFDDIYDLGRTMEAVAREFRLSEFNNIDIFALIVTLDAKIRVNIVKNNCL